MKTLLLLACLFFTSSALVAAGDEKPPELKPDSKPEVAKADSTEPWKGRSPDSDFNVGGLGGMAIIDGNVGFAVMGTAAGRIFERGFVSDLSDQVFIEIEVGPVFIKSSTALIYSAHVRWDFKRDDTLSLYGLGGFGGFFSGAALGNTTEFYPRFGIGIMGRVNDALSVRAELSHELVGVGAMYSF